MQAGTLFNQGVLQNFGTLQMGTLAGNNVGTLQSVDYSYHIRGGLRGINLDASGNLTNKLFSMKLEYEDDGNYFDGNIRRQYWKSNIDGIQRAFAYNYDGASRIISADYGSTKAGESYALENMSYDANGNILSLSRKGKTGVNSWGYIDQLSYVYEANSNKIKKVSDLQSLSNQNVGDFRDSSNVATEYEYWLDGSLKIDRNKKISQVDYNYLKLPKQVTFEGGQWIRNQYDASGKKLKSTTSDGIIYDYVSNKIYKNGTLYQISQDEGRIINGNYEYDYKDHLGNLRVSFRDSSGIAKVVTKLDYDPWGLTLKGLDYSNPTFNKNNFQFGSKEKVETFGLNWIDFGARQYMPDVPHFTTVDPLAEISRRFSPYTYANDNPILMIDPDGMASTYNWGSGQYENERGEQVSWGSVQQEYGIESGDDTPKKNAVVRTDATRVSSKVALKPKPDVTPLQQQNATMGAVEFGSWFSPEDKAAQTGVNIAGAVEGGYGIVKGAAGLKLLLSTGKIGKEVVNKVNLVTIDAIEDNVMIFSAKIGDEIVEGISNFAVKDGKLYLDKLHLQGSSPGNVGRESLWNMAKDLGSQYNVKEVIIQGGRRTTGKYKGQVPSPITIKVE